MQRPTLLLAAAAVFLAGCGSSAAQREADAGSSATGASLPEVDQIAAELANAVRDTGKKRVAVMELTGLGGKASGVSRLLGDRLLAAMGNQGLELIERSRLKEVIEEQALGQTGLIGADAIKVGELAGAEALVVGNVTVLAAVVDLHARAVDIETGRVLGLAGRQIPRPSLAAYIDADTPVATAPELTLSTIFLGEHNAGDRWEERIVRQGSTLSSGDGLKIIFETNRDASIYALLIDSRGKGSVIFPQENIAASNQIRGGRQVEIPPGTDWFFLDENTGTETIYVLGSLTPMPNIAELVRRLEAMGIGRTEAEENAQISSFMGGAGPGPDGLIKRGIGGIQKGHVKRVQLSDGGIIEQAADRMTGAGAVVRAVSFVHE